MGSLIAEHDGLAFPARHGGRRLRSSASAYKTSRAVQIVGSPMASTVFQPRGKKDQGSKALQDRGNRRSQDKPTKASWKQEATKLTWATKMSQKAKSPAEKRWAAQQVAKAQEKIATGWREQLQAKAKAARAAKAEWEKRESPAEQQWRQALQLRADIAEINNAITQEQEAALERIRQAEEEARLGKQTSLQQIQALEDKLLQLKTATETQKGSENKPPEAT